MKRNNIVRSLWFKWVLLLALGLSTLSSRALAAGVSVPVNGPTQYYDHAVQVDAWHWEEGWYWGYFWDNELNEETWQYGYGAYWTYGYVGIRQWDNFVTTIPNTISGATYTITLPFSDNVSRTYQVTGNGGTATLTLNIKWQDPFGADPYPISNAIYPWNPNNATAVKDAGGYVYDGTNNMPVGTNSYDPDNDPVVNWGSYADWDGSTESWVLFEGNPFEVPGTKINSGSPAWDAATKQGVGSANTLVATVITNLAADSGVKAKIEDMLVSSRESYRKRGFSILSVRWAREYSVVYWVNANGNRVGGIQTHAGEKEYQPGEDGNVESNWSGSIPDGGVYPVLLHTHQWGTNISGGTSGPGDFAISNVQPNGAFVFAVRMGLNSVQLVTPQLGSMGVFSGTPSDFNINSSLTARKSGFEGY